MARAKAPVGSVPVVEVLAESSLPVVVASKEYMVRSGEPLKAALRMYFAGAVAAEGDRGGAGGEGGAGEGVENASGGDGVTGDGAVGAVGGVEVGPGGIDHDGVGGLLLRRRGSR